MNVSHYSCSTEYNYYLIESLQLKIANKMLICVRYSGLIIFISQICLCFSQNSLSQQRFVVDYQGSSKVANIIGTEQQKFYVDLGAYDPIFLSNTLELEMAGWAGINVEPSHTRNSRFFVLRPGQVNLNTAIGDSTKLVTLYNLKRSELSTTNPEEQEKKNLVDTLTVPSISLKELCERYYKTRPTLINIGFQDDVDKVLEGNNWALPKCVPDVFVVANRKHIPDSPISKYRQRLTEKKYQKFDILWSDAEVYVKEALMEGYKKKYLVSQDQIHQKQVIKFSELIGQFSILLNKKIASQVSQNEVGLYFAKTNQVINVQDLLKQTETMVRKELSSNGNVPTIVFNFKLRSNTIIVNNCSFSLEKIVDQKFDLLNLTILGSAAVKKSRSIYILDYKQSSENIVPKVVVLNEVCSQVGSKFVAQGSGQANTAHDLSISDYIIEVVFSVTFLVCFLSFTVLIFFYLHSSLKDQINKKNQIARMNQESELSTIN